MPATLRAEAGIRENSLFLEASDNNLKAIDEESTLHWSEEMVFQSVSQL